MLLIAAMIFTILPIGAFADASETVTFSDVKRDDYFAEAAAALKTLGIIDGYPDGTYRAEKSITRAEMAAVVCRMLGKENDAEKAVGSTAFSDVTSTHWASGYINICAKIGIISGDGDGKFRPEDDVKYEEAIKMIVCAMGYADDVKIDPDDWSKEYLNIAKDEGISDNLKGTKGKAATRGDIAVMTYNALAADSQDSIIPAAPVASVKSGEYKGAQKVKLTTATQGADIYYTTDNTVPTVKSTKYTKEITISKTCTLKAIAVTDNVISKDILSETYTIKNVSSGGGGASSAKSYTVTFNLNYDGAAGDLEKQSVRSGNKAAEPAVPVRDGYTFSGWFTDENCEFTYDFSQPVTENITLYANWSITDDTKYTRAEWINILMDKVGAEIKEHSSVTNYYADTEEHYLGEVVESAREYGIIPSDEDEQDVPVFNPDEAADREFAAVTATLAMGYVDDGTEINCADKSEIKYARLIKVAVKAGFLNLENGYFYPGRDLVGTEKNQIFDRISKVKNSETISEQIEDISYAEDVIATQLSGITDYEITEEDGGWVVDILECDETKLIKENTYFVLPPNDKCTSGISLKAISVFSENGRIIIHAVKPEDVSKIVSKIVYAGKGTPLVDEIEVLDENVTCTYEPDGKIDDDISLYGEHGRSVSVPGKFKFDFGEGLKIGESTKLKGNVEVEIPDITAYIDADFKWFNTSVNELTFSITEKAKVTGKLEYTDIESEIRDNEPGAKELTRFPIEIVPGVVSVDLIVSLYYDVKGTVSIIYTATATEGLQYKNGQLRYIGNLNSKLDIPKIEGKARMGLQLGGHLYACNFFDVIGADIKIGAAGTVSVTNHSLDNLCCIDGTIYLDSSVALSEESALGYFLKEKMHYTLEKVFYDENTSPCKLKLHFENLQKVPECTYGKGEISGHVYDASSREPIKFARVSIYQGNDLKAVKYTDADGKYQIKNGIPVGNVNIKISATGYKTYSDNRNINRNSVTYIESYMMVGRSDEGQGNVNGRFINALTGENISDVRYEVRDGWNNTTGDVLIESSSNGTYNFDIMSGNYTVLAIADKYISNSANITVVDGACVQADITLSPENSEVVNPDENIRFVLTWGATPSDLDSHLFGPSVNGEGIFHTFYGDKNYYSDKLIANLDLDDTTSYGPETTTIYCINNSGTYSFYVHDYTNRSSNVSNALSLSDAKVEIYNGNVKHAVFNVPTSIPGTVWHVFDYDAATGTITPVNTMSFSSDPDRLGVYSAELGIFSEDMAIREIYEMTILDK